ncbi:MAG: hypothetical protein ACI9VR_001645 [Cognaticolwellia sp.]|jgi:hypothetical protein
MRALVFKFKSLLPLAVALLSIGALSACAGDGNFSQTTDGPDVTEGAGELSLAGATLVWTELEPGVSVGNTLYFENVGELNLIIKQARVTSSAGGTFYLPETEDKTVGPGDSYEMSVVATLPGDQPKSGKLQVKTNDPLFTDFIVDLEAYPVGWDTGTDTGDSGTDTGDSGADTGTDTGTDTGDSGTDTGTDTGE